MIATLLLKFESNVWKATKRDKTFSETNCQLVLVFGQKELIAETWLYSHLRSQFPVAAIVFSSTSGEILQRTVSDQTIVVSALHFEKTSIKAISANIFDYQQNSNAVGLALAAQLQGEHLAGILVFSDGMHVNGGELVAGLNANNHTHIPITGGLAGDGSDFKSTLTGLNKVATEGEIVAIGFYGTAIDIGHGSLGGWDEFGHERTITKAEKNVLFELDHKKALDLYKEYLGPYSAELPASALLFPLSIQVVDSKQTLVRTILSIDEESQSMTFAGNMPVGSKVRLMKANFDKLINASSIAASSSKVNTDNPEFALLISCVGRKLILQERTEEEIESAAEVLGSNCAMAGFYSYGEISPLNNTVTCELHNQTMTITTFTEK